MRAGGVKTGMMMKTQGKTQQHGYKGPLCSAKGLDFVHQWAMTAQSLNGTHTTEELFWNMDADSEAMGCCGSECPAVRVQQGPDDEGSQEAGT